MRNAMMLVGVLALGFCAVVLSVSQAAAGESEKSADGNGGLQSWEFTLDPGYVTQALNCYSNREDRDESGRLLGLPRTPFLRFGMPVLMIANLEKRPTGFVAGTLKASGSTIVLLGITAKNKSSSERKLFPARATLSVEAKGGRDASAIAVGDSFFVCKSSERLQRAAKGQEVIVKPGKELKIRLAFACLPGEKSWRLVYEGGTTFDITRESLKPIPDDSPKTVGSILGELSMKEEISKVSVTASVDKGDSMLFESSGELKRWKAGQKEGSYFISSMDGMQTLWSVSITERIGSDSVPVKVPAVQMVKIDEDRVESLLAGTLELKTDLAPITVEFRGGGSEVLATFSSAFFGKKGDVLSAAGNENLIHTIRLFPEKVHYIRLFNE